MPWTTPGTATAGSVLTASFWNTQVRDNMNSVGMVFIKNQAFSAASTIDVTSCFSSTWTHYTILIEAVHASTNNSISFQMLSGTTPSTASYAFGYTQVDAGAGPTRTYNGSTTSAFCGFLTNDGAGKAVSNITIMRPFLADKTGYVFNTAAGSQFYGVGGGVHNVATSYDGIRLLVASTTASGNATVYGHTITG